MLRYSLIAIFAASVQAEDLLTVASWGGEYERAQKLALFDPFEEESGLQINTVRYDGLAETVSERALEQGWDVIDMTEDQAITSCDKGLLLELDGEAIVWSDGTMRLDEDFAANAFRECSIVHSEYATVIAFDDRVYPGIKPSAVEDFFDLDNFPGLRALHKSPDAILEWALLAEGVPAAEVYDLLSTDRGLRLAFRKLDTIRDQIIWWQDAAEPPHLLATGAVSMASGYNGRFFSAAQDKQEPVTIIWDGRLIGRSVWAVSKHTQRRIEAETFIRFATDPDQMANLAELIPYGPARLSAVARVGLGVNTGVPMRPHLPNAPELGGRKLRPDSVWYSRTADLRNRRFEQWLADR